MKRTFTKSMLLTLACVAVFHGAALAQRGERAGPGGGMQAHDRSEFGPPGGPPGGPMGGPMMMGGPGGGFGLGGRHPGGPGFPPPPSMEDLERAGVTATQRAKIRDLHDDSMRRMIRGEADLRIAELDLHKLLDDDRPDAGAVEATIDRIGGMRTALWKAQVTEMLAVRAVLTPEQRTKLRQGAGARERR